MVAKYVVSNGGTISFNLLYVLSLSGWPDESLWMRYLMAARRGTSNLGVILAEELKRADRKA
jgi:hypothetical protein